MQTHDAFNAGIPSFGTWILDAVVVFAALAFVLSVHAGTRAHPSHAARWLLVARRVGLAACTLVAVDVFLLLYAFLAHDFRIRYVAHYSDRSMSVAYLVTALWGGQDGSLLWWLFLVAMYAAAAILWLRTRYRELAPWVVATLMAIIGYFGVLMLYAANPFAANIAGAPADGDGLNPQLQNFYMAIHPPSLYVGFTGVAVPFAFAVAALVTGRLGDEWIKATRKWALFAWLFLSIGNVLGMLWAYEELGWGGYWAWDPVENAACIPWFTITAYLHSVMIQERRGTLKVWNISLVLFTFLLTVFGTFLTRSGLISSVHAFAQTGIGTWFVWMMAVVAVLSVALVVWRLPLLRKLAEIDALLSREATFVLNNWLLLGISLFISIATVWPKVSEVFWEERLTVGASFFNGWLSVPGMLLLGLFGVGTLTPWRKGSPELIWRAFRAPLAVGLTTSILHAVLGGRFGYTPFFEAEPIYPSAVGRGLAAVQGHLPVIATGLIAFNLSAVVQEFAWGARSRMKSKGENPVTALATVVGRNRRRYGGYTVHVGIALMYLGFTGSAWKQESEAELNPGESFRVGRYELRYDGVRSRRAPDKREIYADVTVTQEGRPFGRVSPAKFIYTARQEMPTSEVSISSGPRDDLYVVLASVDPVSKRAHLKGFVNPLVAWIWIGALVLILGTALAMWPETSLAGALAGAGAGAGGLARAGGSRLAMIAVAAGLTFLTGDARAQGHTISSPPPVAGDVEVFTPAERRMFDQLLCMCGDCQRLPLATCTCDFAAAKRRSMRARLTGGESSELIVASYVEQFGPSALAVPPDAGHNRAVYGIPIAVLAGSAGLAFRLIRTWRTRRHAGVTTPTVAAPDAPTDAQTSEYDRRLDQELRGHDD